MLILRTDYPYVPSGQNFTLIAEGSYPNGDYLEIWDITDSSNEYSLGGGPSPTWGITTSKVLSAGSGPIGYVFQARAVNPSTGVIDDRSYPIRIIVSFEGNGSDQGYIPNYTNPQKGCVLVITGGEADAGTTDFQPTVQLFPMNFVDPVYQFWYENDQGTWTSFPSSGFSTTSTFTMPPLTNSGSGAFPGVWHITGYVKESGDLDAKPYLAKGHTYAIAAGQTQQLSLSTSPSPLWAEMDVTAASGYDQYQWWIARIHSNNVHSVSYTQKSNTLVFTPNAMGTYRLQAYGQMLSNTGKVISSTLIGTSWLNVQDA